MDQRKHWRRTEDTRIYEVPPSALSFHSTSLASCSLSVPSSSCLRVVSSLLVS